MERLIAGIDYGSKTSGFTCASVLKKNKVHLFQAKKNQNADESLKVFMEKFKPQYIGIDAPLSIPGVLRELKGFTNYHFRQADLEAKAMSPMFLGGLTARAIEIASWFKSEWGTKVIEVYPKLVSQELLLDTKRYKKEAAYLPSAVQSLARAVEWDLSNINIDNWHQFDSLLALYATERYSNNKAQSLGNKQEGLIYF